MTGWTPPTTTDDEGKKVIKPEVDWSNDDDLWLIIIIRHYTPFLIGVMLSISN